MKRLIAFISILMLASVVSGTATSITIYGTNRSNAQTNITCNGCNNSIYVNAWNTSYVKNITVNSSNASGDVISFNISNVTGYQVQELKANKTAINAYQAGANGMLNFTYNVTGNKTLELSPAIKANGYNFTWGWFWNALPNASIPLIAANLSANNTFTGDKNTFGDNGSNARVTINSIPTSDFALRLLKSNTANVLRNDYMIGSDGLTINAFNDTGGVYLPIKIDALKLDVTGVISGNGSGLSSLNASNITIGTLMKTVTVNRSYVKDTVYQNTNSSAMFMTITAYASGAGTSGCNYKTGTTNPPTDFVGSQAEANADMQSFWVLPQHYFAAFQSSGTCTLLYWSVWQ